MSAVFLLFEPVSIPANRLHQTGVVPGRLNLITESLDMGVDGLRLRQVFPTPGIAQQVLARKDVYKRQPPRAAAFPIPTSSLHEAAKSGNAPSALMPGKDGGGKEAKERAPEAGALSWGGEESLQKACADEGA